MRTEKLIPEADVRAALSRAADCLTETSEDHGLEIGAYIARSFRPNPELVPIGVAIMYMSGSKELEKLMEKAVYPSSMSNVVNNIVLAELRKLPGVDDVFARFEG